MSNTSDRVDTWRVECSAIIVSMQRVDYTEAAELLLDTHSLFLNINRKSAYYARKRLEELTGKKIKHYPGVARGRRGYLFRISNGNTPPLEDEQQCHN